MAKSTIIYCLVDPRNGEPRYVGKTVQELEVRVNCHMQDKSNCHRVHWLNELKREGLKPDYFIIEEIEGAWPWQESERFWIGYFKRSGFKLTNNTSGGDGVPNLPPETRARMRLTWLGKKHKPETIEKLRACRPNYKHSEETKARMSASQKGRKILWIDKIAKSLRKITTEQAEAIKQRLLNGERVTAIAKELSIHRTTISKIKMGTYFLPYRRQK